MRLPSVPAWTAHGCAASKRGSGIRVETLLLLAKALDIPAAEILTAMEKALDSAPEQK